MCLGTLGPCSCKATARAAWQVRSASPAGLALGLPGLGYQLSLVTGHVWLCFPDPPLHEKWEQKLPGQATAPRFGDPDLLEDFPLCAWPCRRVPYPPALGSTHSLTSNETQLVQKRTPTRALPSFSSGLFLVGTVPGAFFHLADEGSVP